MDNASFAAFARCVAQPAPRRQPYETCLLDEGLWLARLDGVGVQLRSERGYSGPAIQVVPTQGLDRAHCDRAANGGELSECALLHSLPLLPPALVLSHPSSFGQFFHFHLEQLPRLLWWQLLRRALPALQLLTPALRAWQAEALSFAGVSEADMHVPATNRLAAHEAVFLPGYGSVTGTAASHLTKRAWPSAIHPVALHFLVGYHRRVLEATAARSRGRWGGRPSPLAAAAVHRGDDASPVYFARFDATSGADRRMINERSLIRGLRSCGWSILAFGNLSLRSRAHELAQRPIAATPFGSGRANLLYAPPSCRFVFICAPQLCRTKDDTVMASLVEALGHPPPIYLANLTEHVPSKTAAAAKQRAPSTWQAQGPIINSQGVVINQPYRLSSVRQAVTTLSSLARGSCGR